MKTIEITSRDKEDEEQEVDLIHLNKGDSAIVFRSNENNQAFLSIGKDEKAKATRYAVAFCLYAMSSDVIRHAFEVHMFDEIAS